MLSHKHVIVLSFVLIYSVNDLVSLPNVRTFEKQDKIEVFPQIVADKFPMDIVSDSELLLGCIGKKKLHWIYPLHIKDTDRLNIFNAKDNVTYVSKFRVKNMKFSDTGEYKCCSVLNNTRNCSRVNVYVNDYEHLLLPEPEIINVYNNSVTVIPCRGTFSNLNVTLWKRSEYVPINDNIKYHPLWGFIIKNSTSYFSGLFWCKVKYDHYEQELMFDLNYKYAIIRPPKINVNAIVDIPKGSDIVIKCNGERSMYWKYPDATIYFNNSRWNVFVSAANKLEHEITIKITDARVDDSGPFMCCYDGYECHETKTAAYSFLRVNDPEKLYIPKIETVMTEEMSCIPYVVQCIPSMPNVTVELQYYKLNATSLDSIPFKDEFSYMPTVGFIPVDFRKIREMNRLGIFSCKYTYGKFLSRQLENVLLLDPRFSMQMTAINENPFENDEVEFICEACTFSFKNITWKWKKNGQGNAVSVVNDKTLSGVTIVDESTKYNLKKILRFGSISSQNVGTYLCIGVTTDYLQEQKSVNLRIKELEKPSFIKTNMDGTNVTVPIGKKFEFLCIVHGKPSPVITWYKDDRIFNETNITGIEFYVEHLKLTIIRVSRRHAGTYRCEAKNKAGVISAELTLNKNMTVKGNLAEARVSSRISPVLSTFIILCVFLSIGLFIVILIIIRYKIKTKRYF